MKTKPTILVVDDNMLVIKTVAEILKEQGFDTVLANSSEFALNYLEKEQVDLVLLDIVMPNLDGFEVCKIIKSKKKFDNLPIIFLTARYDVKDVVRGFELGGVDYITKPFNSVELLARIKTHIELKKYRDEVDGANELLRIANKELNEINQLIKAKNIHLKEMMNELNEFAKTDPLTHLANRRGMSESINEEIFKFRRSGRPFSLLMVDIDFFKKVNDTYGHDCGDYILKSIADCFVMSLRETDTISRWGGEEFLLLLPAADSNDAVVVAEKLRYAVEKLHIQYSGIVLNITVTIGVATFFESGSNIQDVVKRADHAMYIGKRNGKNQVNYA